MAENREIYGEYSVDDEDQLQPKDSLVDRGVDDALDEGYSPPERWSSAERYGNTPWEEEHGESLDQRIAQEEPEPDPYLAAEDGVEDEDVVEDGADDERIAREVGNARAGRLVAHTEPDGEFEQDLDALDVGIDGAGASAEEAAMHIIDAEL